MAVLKNRAKMSTSTTGTGTITLGSALAGFQSFDVAGVSNGDQVRYTIQEGVNFELGLGTYTASGTTLSRTPSESSNSGSAISLSGNAEVFITAAAEDILSDVVDDTTPQLGGNLDVQTREITTSTSNGNVKITPNGSGVVEVKGAGGNDGTLQLNCSANSHGVKIKSPPHSAGATYTLTLPNDDGSSGQSLISDGSGNLSFTTITSNATHTGEVTGSGALTIADNIVDEANLKVSNSPTNGYFLSAQSGNTGGLTWAAAGAELYAANPSSATSPTAGGTNAIGIGDGAAAAGNDSVSFGSSALSTSTNSIAIGLNAESIPPSGYTSADSIAIGRDSEAKGTNNIAIGREAMATTNSYDSQQRILAVGHYARASGGSDVVAIGHSKAGGDASLAIAIGTNSQGALGTQGIGIGKGAFSDYSYSVALGASALANANYATALGYDSEATGVSSIAIGNDAWAYAENSIAIGTDARADIIGKCAIASGYFAANGDAQGCTFILRSDTTNATAEAMTTNNSSASSNNQVIVGTDSCMTFSGTIVGMQNGAQAYGSWKIEGLLVNDGGTTTVPNSAITVISNTSNWGLALSADNSNNALKVQVTGEASHNIRWVAHIQAAEVKYS